MVMLMYFTFSGSDADDIDIEHWLVNETNLKHLRVNVSKNREKFKKRGRGQKIDFAHTLSV